MCPCELTRHKIDVELGRSCGWESTQVLIDSRAAGVPSQIITSFDCVGGIEEKRVQGFLQGLDARF